MPAAGDASMLRPTSFVFACLPLLASPAIASSALDSFMCYRSFEGRGEPSFADRLVTLQDDLNQVVAVVDRPDMHCNPVSQDDEPMVDTTAHLECYDVDLLDDDAVFRREVLITNRFGEQRLMLEEPETLCLPSEKDGIPATSILEHFNCYEATEANGASHFPDRTTTLDDQFGRRAVRLSGPRLFCTPVDKNGEGIGDPTAHLTCYDVDDDPTGPRTVVAENQFGLQVLVTAEGKVLCVPTTRLDPAVSTTSSSTSSSSTSSSSISSTSSSSSSSSSTSSSSSSSSTLPTSSS